MAALTQDIVRVSDSLPESGASEVHTIAATRICFQGSVCMQVAGKARPLVAGVANSVLLGVAMRHYEAGATDLVAPDGAPFVFERGVKGYVGKVGDLPTEALVDVVGGVYFGDDNTVQATAPGAPNLGGTLRYIRDGLCWVEI